MDSLQHWRVVADWDGTTILYIDKHDASVNALSHDLITELELILTELHTKAIPGLIIMSMKQSGFSVGADVTEFTNIDQVQGNIETGHRSFNLLARAPFPTVAAIHGHCLGGGTELALVCTHRVASDDALIGLPEVKLGIHPGWGGTARLPDLIGGHNALPMMLQGKPVKAKAALSLGLVSAVCKREDLKSEARRVLYNSTPPSLVSQCVNWASNTWPLRELLSQVFLWQTKAKVSQDHYPAPFSIIQLWREYGSLEHRLANEAASVYRLAQTSTANNLVKIFLTQELLKKGDKNSHGFKHIHIIGSTVLAGDLAALLACKEFQVTTRDNVDAQAQKFFKRKQSSDLVRQRLSNDPTGVASADLIIEALPEDFELKQALFEEIEPQIKPGALIATTTGVFPLEKLATGLSEDLVGLHFFEPVCLVPLVEVAQTYEASRMVSFCKFIGKIPVIVQDIAGFLVNRILAAYIFEALYMLEEGIPATAIDKAAITFGMPMGPLEYLDTIGLDVWAVYAKEIAPVLGLPIPKTLVNPEFFGKAHGRGIFEWAHGRPKKPATSTSIAPDRVMYALVCEAINASNTKVTAGPDLVDAAMVFSTGFAPFRGGPINYSRSEPEFNDTLDALTSAYPSRFTTKRRGRDFFNVRDD